MNKITNFFLKRTALFAWIALAVILAGLVRWYITRELDLMVMGSAMLVLSVTLELGQTQREMRRLERKLEDTLTTATTAQMKATSAELQSKTALSAVNRRHEK